MSRVFYPAIFHKTYTNQYWISFPDFPDVLSQGNTVEQAYEMAVDALGFALLSFENEGSTPPVPSTLENVPVKKNTEGAAFTVLISFDTVEYKKKTSSKSVKRSVTLPSWLNEAAISKGINFSAALQEALKEHLEIQ